MASITSPAALILHTSTKTGSVRIAPRLSRNQAVLEVLDTAGEITQLRLSPDDMRRLAAGLMKVAAALESSNQSEEATQP